MSWDQDGASGLECLHWINHGCGGNDGEASSCLYTEYGEGKKSVKLVDVAVDVL